MTRSVCLAAAGAVLAIASAAAGPDQSLTIDKKVLSLSAARRIVAAAETEARGRSAGADEFLSKPIVQAALFDAMAVLLGLIWIPGTPAPTPQAAAPADDAAELAPPPALVAELRDLARMGNMRLIAAWADRVMALDPRYLPFAARIKALAAAYESKTILNLAESCAAASFGEPEGA